MKTHLIMTQHTIQLLVALLGDKNTLCRCDAAAARKTVIQSDLRFLQLLLLTVLDEEHTSDLLSLKAHTCIIHIRKKNIFLAFL